MSFVRSVKSNKWNSGYSDQIITKRICWKNISTNSQIVVKVRTIKRSEIDRWGSRYQKQCTPSSNRFALLLVYSQDQHSFSSLSPLFTRVVLYLFVIPLSSSRNACPFSCISSLSFSWFVRLLCHPLYLFFFFYIAYVKHILHYPCSSYLILLKKNIYIYHLFHLFA